MKPLTWLTCAALLLALAAWIDRVWPFSPAHTLIALMLLLPFVPALLLKAHGMTWCEVIS